MLVASFSACKNKAALTEKVSSAKDFQYDLNIKFADKSTSILTDTDFKTFSSLHFFPIADKYIVNAVFKQSVNEKSLNMVTTTSRLAVYKKYGEAHFEIDGKKLKLNIYQNQELVKKAEYKNHLFLPFTDITNDKETYAGGRYIDITKPKGDTIVIDFNKAYNPYCAYNNRYSCPIPPSENYLNVPIKAGVLKFH